MPVSTQIKVPGGVKLPGGSGSGGGGGSVALADITDWPSGVSATEVGYLDGVTSAIQTQLGGKAASSHTHAASDIASGEVALARGGTGSDLSATGGAGQVLKQTSVGGAVSVGAISSEDLPSHTHAISDTTGLQTALDGKLSLTGGDLTGNIRFADNAEGIFTDTADDSDNQSLVLSSTDGVGAGRGGSITLYGNEESTTNKGRILFQVGSGDGSSGSGGLMVMMSTGQIGIRMYHNNGNVDIFGTLSCGNGLNSQGWTSLTNNHKLLFTVDGIDLSSSECGVSRAAGGGGTLRFNVPTGGGYRFCVNGLQMALIDGNAASFNEVRSSSFNPNNTNTRGRFGGTFNGSFYSIGQNPGAQDNAGGCSIQPISISISGGSNRRISQAPASRTGFLFITDTTNNRVAVYYVQAGVVALFGTWHSQWVVSATPGSTEIGVAGLPGDIRVYNGYPTSVSIAVTSIGF